MLSFAQPVRRNKILLRLGFANRLHGGITCTIKVVERGEGQLGTRDGQGIWKLIGALLGAPMNGTEITSFSIEFNQ